LIAAAAMLGLLFGSFATVVAHRVPRRESIVSGRSKCPRCDNVLSPAENVPVFSYLWQGGRCRHCAGRISLRYPAIEITNAVLFALAAWKFGLTMTAVVYAGFFWVLLVLSVIDIDHHLLPTRIIVPAFIVGWAGLAFAAIFAGQPDRLTGALIGSVLFGGFILAIAFAYPPGMGLGDVRLAFVLGSFLGYLGGAGVVLVGMFLSFLLGALIGIAAMRISGGTRKMQVPFGPSLALGTVVAVFAGGPLLEAYLRL
jgi:leader peptidase (prepilin peptidase)/N-methyltransferase